MLRRTLPLSFIFLFVGASTAPFFPGSDVLFSEILGAGPQVGGWGMGGNPRPGSPLAFFEFAPASGAGLRASCACAAITGAKGETVTWTRGSSAMCTKSASESSIANGDLVLCGSNLPRVMSLGGPLGVLVESSRQNNAIQSQAIDNAAWTALGAGGSTSPTVTADFAVAPDGTTTAERVQISACASASQASVMLQNYTGTAAATSGSLYIKGNAGTSGTISIYFYDTTALTGNAVQCAFNGTTWNRCGTGSNPALTKTFANATHRFAFGCINDAVITGSTSTGAADILAWQTDSQAGAYMTSPIPTTTVAVTRSADTNATTLNQPVGTASFAATRVGTTVTPSGARVWSLTSNGGAAYGIGAYQNIGAFNALVTGAVPAQSYAATLTGNDRAWFAVDGTNWFGNFAGASNTAANAGLVGAGVTTLCIGIDCSGGGSGWADGIISRVCVDPNPNRCR